jgi:hypothetical protein
MAMLFLLIGIIFGLIAGLMAFLITWKEYEKHRFRGRRLFGVSFRAGLFAFLFFLIMALTTGYILVHWVIPQ